MNLLITRWYPPLKTLKHPALRHIKIFFPKILLSCCVESFVVLNHCPQHDSDPLCYYHVVLPLCKARCQSFFFFPFIEILTKSRRKYIFPLHKSTKHNLVGIGTSRTKSLSPQLNLEMCTQIFKSTPKILADVQLSNTLNTCHMFHLFKQTGEDL